MKKDELSSCGMELKMKRIVSKTPFLLIFPLLTAYLVHSDPNQQNQSDQPIKLNTELVVLDVLVLNKKTGRVVGGLKKEDFSIYEEGVKQQIIHFSQDKLPLSVVLLIDIGGSVRPILKQMQVTKQIRERAIAALQHLKPEDEVALIATATKTQIIEGFTKDRKLIIDKIEKLDERALGGRGILLNDAIYEAAAYLRKASNPGHRRVIIAITDNITNQWVFEGHSEKESLRELFETGSVACGLIVQGPFSRMQYVTNKRPGIFFWRKLLLSGDIYNYAEKTGGIVLSADRENSEIKLAELIDYLRARYTLAYMPSNQKLDGKFRKIKVEISPEVEKREGKLAVLARRGYYARRSDAASTRDDERQRPPR
jgi:VWFA-related protein